MTAPSDSDADEWGTWPIVFGTHGRGGSGDGLAATAAELASHGVVVFAPTYRSTEGQHIEQDLECAYRYSMSIAEDYGADLDQPVTSFGHSLGASMALFGGLSEAAYGPGGTYDACFTGVPRSDVIVAVAGCHYQYEGEQYPFDMTGYSNMDADVILVAGTDDECVSCGSPRMPPRRFRLLAMTPGSSRSTAGTMRTLSSTKSSMASGCYVPAIRLARKSPR